MPPDCPPPPAAVAPVDALRIGHFNDQVALSSPTKPTPSHLPVAETIAALRRINREQADMIEALRDENRRLRDDLARLGRRAQDRPGNDR